MLLFCLFFFDAVNEKRYNGSYSYVPFSVFELRKKKRKLDYPFLIFYYGWITVHQLFGAKLFEVCHELLDCCCRNFNLYALGAPVSPSREQQGPVSPVHQVLISYWHRRVGSRALPLAGQCLGLGRHWDLGDWLNYFPEHSGLVLCSG